eukprot:gene6786-biopygen5968
MESRPPPPTSRDHQFQTAEAAAARRRRAHGGHSGGDTAAGRGHRRAGAAGRPAPAQVRCAAAAVGLGLHPATLPRPRARMLRIWRRSAEVQSVPNFHFGQPRAKNGDRVIPRISLTWQTTAPFQPHPPQASNRTLHVRTSLKRGRRLSLQRHLRGHEIAILVMTAEHDNLAEGENYDEGRVEPVRDVGEHIGRRIVLRRHGEDVEHDARPDELGVSPGQDTKTGGKTNPPKPDTKISQFPRNIDTLQHSCTSRGRLFRKD